MSISWYLGFGWMSMATLVACGVGINLADGWLRWVLYVPFLLVGLHMSIRFRSFSTQPWRRVHRRTMAAYSKLAVAEYNAAQNRDFDVRRPCRQLADQVFGTDRANAFSALLDAGRKDYYGNLLDSYPQVFVAGIKPELHEKVIENVHRDIDASELGPDIVIAKEIELRHGGLEAARYLQALLLGRVN